MNTPFDDIPNEEAIRRYAHLCILMGMSESEKSVLRTRLLWEEGLFCDNCKRRELKTREELRMRHCKKCAIGNTLQLIG
jgi:hypothetical protein